ncbi:hypothetical protein [Phycicoccus sp. Soil802]|uniref:hypothetical protein n=1 Tax=Phycicoccus sp. Soil802 TaxID=1736414 RepID=UPI000702B4A1|nr:hypothetical protein [Phycicoccus sp. Soil802]KRF28502.1 hypothetical protein ASG91_08625 [Phycicoccus sp. Soil802]
MSEPTGPARPRSTKGSAKTSQDPSAGEPQADAPQAADPQATAPQPATPAPTQPLPAAAASGPAVSEAAPAGPSPAGPPSGPPSGLPPAGPPGGPFGPATGGPGGPPPKGPGLWRQATSTTGGLIAVVVAAALATLLVLGTVATVGFVAVRAAHHDGSDRVERIREDGRQGLPPGQQRKLDRMPQGPEMPRRQGGGLGDGLDEDQGDGMGGLMRGAMGLGNVQHGEFTVQQDGKAVVMTVQRGTVTKSSATSVTVKSDDAFTATYVIGDDTRTRKGAPAVGDSVLVVAEKTGAKAVLIATTRKG